MEDKYRYNNICDGTEWKPVIIVNNKNAINKSGSNEYPPY